MREPVHQLAIPRDSAHGALLESHKDVLEKIIRGARLAEVLAALCRIVETQASGHVVAAILLTDAEGRRLYTGAAPGLPEGYNRAVDGLPVDPQLGTCCAAAARREAVCTVDIATDPAWSALAHLPLELGLKAAWSLPILSSSGRVLGTFGTYFGETRAPTHAERQLVEVLARTAALAIERHATDAELRENASRHRFLAELAAQTQRLTEPEAVMAVSARLLAEYLDVDRCAYARVEDERVFVIPHDHCRGVPSIVGSWDVAAFGPACVADMTAGVPFVASDTHTDPRIGPEHVEAYRATAIRAVVCVPVHKEGRFTAAMAVHQSRPRVFTSSETGLVELVAARCWEALERVRITRTLQASEARYRQIVETRGRLEYAAGLSGVGFWYCELPFDVLNWDARVKEHFFLPPDAVVTIDDFYNRMHPEDREPTRIAIELSLRNRTSYDTVYRTVDPHSGAMRWIRAIGGAAIGADGAPTHFDGVTVDVSEQRLVQERLAAALEQVREQDRRKDEFLATLAHELRNPLAPITNGLQILRTDRGAEANARTREMMDRQLRHLVHMVDDLLDISRITLGKIELRRTRTDFRPVLESALESTRQLVEAGGHRLSIQMPESELPIDADHTRLAQVLANLINNAAKFTPAGGSIRIEAQAEASQLVVRVSDDGIGIPQDMLSNVFDMFTQVGRSIERRHGGLGIGLTLVRRLVEMHGGSVVAESRGLGLGTTFVLRLPLLEVSGAQDACIAGAEPASTRMQVLVVDDNVDAAESLAMLLQLDGHATRTAHSGPEAMRVIEEFDADAVFLDIGLPGMSGYEVAPLLRSAAARRNRTALRLIALTGWGSSDDRRRAQAAGFDHHVVKPIDPDHLSAALGSRPT